MLFGLIAYARDYKNLLISKNLVLAYAFIHKKWWVYCKIRLRAIKTKRKQGKGRAGAALPAPWS